MKEKEPVMRRKTKGSKFAESFFVKYGLKMILGFVVIVVFLTSIQCSIKKPEAPTWNSNLTVPMINRTYLMSEIIDKIDQPGIEMDSLGNVMFSLEEELDTIVVDENLTINDIHQSVSEVVGQLDISPGNPAPSSIYLSDMGILTLGVIPDISFDITHDFPAISGFSWADVVSGGSYIKINNDFDIDLDTVIMEIISLGDMSTIAIHSFPGGIADGDVDSTYIDLSGHRISNQFRALIHCHTPGAVSFSLSADQKLTTGVDLGNGMTISAARAETPAINLDFSQQVAIDDSNTIVIAELSSGNVQLTILNETNLPADINIGIDDFQIGGQSLSIDTTVSASSTTNINIDLFGYTFLPVDQSLPQEINIVVAAGIDSSASLVTVSATDSFHVAADITGLNFASMTGVISPTIVNFDPFEVDIDIPKGFDSLQLVNAVLILEIENGLNFPGTLNLDILGDGGQSLNLNGSISAGTAINPQISVIIDSSVAAFLNPMPSVITVNGSAGFGDGITVGTVTENDYIFSRISISSPMEVIIASATFDSDISSESIDQDDIEAITDHLISARFSPTITNHLPLGVTVEIYMDGDSTRLNATDAQLVVGPLSIDPGIIGAGNVVVQPTVSELAIVLDSADTRILENPELYTTQKITITGNGTDPVKLTGADYITVHGTIEIEYKFDGEF